MLKYVVKSNAVLSEGTGEQISVRFSRGQVWRLKGHYKNPERYKLSRINTTILISPEKFQALFKELGDK